MDEKNKALAVEATAETVQADRIEKGMVRMHQKHLQLGIPVPVNNS